MRQVYLPAVLVFSLGLMGFLAGCQRGARDTRAADERAIRDASDVDWLKAAQEKDVERVLSFYADDASVCPPNARIATGKEAIRALWSQLLGSPGFTVNWKTGKVEVSTAGDLAYQLGTYEITVTGPKSKPLTDRGKYVAVWKKQADGQWKVVLDIWNSNPPPAAASTR